MTAERVELAAVRAPFSVAGWVGLGVDAGAVVAALALARRPAPVLGLFLLNATVSAAISLATWRRGLRRVVAPVPVGAVVIPARFLSARLLGSVLATVAVLALSIHGVVSPGVLGAGVGAEVGLLWSARKIGEFERRDGRQVVRATRRRRGQPALYAF
jgi:pimeloyl-ACP methyl ester carboxylesterase